MQKRHKVEAEVEKSRLNAHRNTHNFYSLHARDIDGKLVDFSQFKDKVVRVIFLALAPKLEARGKA